MGRTKQTLLALALAGLSAAAAQAACGISPGRISILSNDFPALHAVADGAEACSGDGVTFSKNQTDEHRNLQVAALSVNPAEYTVAVVANSSIVPLLNDGLARPMDDLVDKFGSELASNQLIRIDGKVMAIAFMANAQHLFYREDILREAGVAVPASYEEMLSAAQAIRDQGLMQYPIAGTYKAGWNLAEEFINMYFGHGGELFAAGSARPSVNNANGVAALEMMKKLTAYMNPDYLTYDSNAVQADWEAGKAALTNLWGSRAAAVTDNEGSTPQVVGNTRFAAAPVVGGGTVPATTLWWDGFVIAQNASAADAEASFRAMLNGITPQIANANSDKAAWLIPGFKPTDKAQGTILSAQARARPYPMLPYVGLMHTALGNELVDFMQGSESAADALADVEAAYIASAQEKGFL